MVSHAGTFTIEPSTRLHRQEAAAPGPSLQLGPGSRGNLTLHVGGWYQQQQAQKPAATPLSYSGESAALPRVYEYSTTNGTTTTTTAGLGQKRAHALCIATTTTTTTATLLSASCDARDKAEALEQSSHKRVCAGQAAVPSSGLRITDLLNPAAGGAPALAAAHRMALPSAMTRSHSADSRHYYHQLAQLQIQVQQQQLQIQAQAQHAAGPADPVARFTRTATAPTEASACAQGIVREALELDKVYDIACVIIESIWPNHSNSQSTLLCSLRCFVAETHRQSRLGIDALELCLFYLLRAKSIIQSKHRAARQKKEDEQQQLQQAESAQQQLCPAKQERSLAPTATLAATPPLSPVHAVAADAAPGSPLGSATGSPITPTDSARSGQAVYVAMDKQQLLGNSMITPLTPHNSKRLGADASAACANGGAAGANGGAAVAAAIAAAAAHREQALPAAKAPAATKPKSDVTMCGRRMFVAALMCASKFMYDRSYANKAWNKFTKLPLEQLGDMERGFLNMIDYRLYVDKNTYDKFHRLLARSCMRNGRLMVCDP
ncbi:hypothetical protein GGF42_002239, partial [Coemansia sp. RSA 2424]